MGVCMYMYIYRERMQICNSLNVNVVCECKYRYTRGCKCKYKCRCACRTTSSLDVDRDVNKDVDADHILHKPLAAEFRRDSSILRSLLMLLLSLCCASFKPALSARVLTSQSEAASTPSSVVVQRSG